jgi:C-22 sterol desaturase
MANINGSFVSPSADATISPQLFYSADFLPAILDGFTVWKALATLLFAAVIYDQRK